MGPRAQPKLRVNDQARKAVAFRELHQRDHAFIIPNPWDVGTARILARLGFEALATTSAGFAFSAGQRDSTMSRDQTMAHVAAIVSATPLPVSADLRNGFGDDPRSVAETINLAAASGLIGGSIEDSAPHADDPIYESELAAERIRAAAEAGKSLAFPFTLTGRVENYLFGRPDLADTIRRLQAYQEAGADVLYAPGVVDRNDIAAIVASIDRPLNVLMATSGAGLSLAQLSAIGVKRVSVGSALSRAALGAFVRAAREMREHGTFEFLDDAASFADISSMLRPTP